MTVLARPEPWRALPADLADLLEGELPAVADEIVERIAAEVPEYARPMEGAFGHAVHRGTRAGLRRFLGLVRDPDSTDAAAREVSAELGRAELGEGRTLDALQAAYRVGARVAWRHLSRVAADAGADTETLSVLAESIFAYIQELSADSVEGYAQAQSEHAGERQQRRAELAALLLSDPPATELAAAAGAARWPLPRSLAAVACGEEALGPLARRLDHDVLSAAVDGLGCLLVPDAAGPGRRAAIAAAIGDGHAALGPTVAPQHAGRSWKLACTALRSVPADGLVVADEHLADLLVAQASDVVDEIARRRLGAFESLKPAARRRLQDTALAYVQHRGNAAAMARVLNVHPQTARYRIAHLRTLLGDALDDPDARFELEAALRAR